MNFQTRLLAPFPPEAVSWRVGSTKTDKTSGLALAYIDARDVMDRLDDVVGPENWQNKYSHASGKVVCDIGIKIDGEWVWKADGAGDTDVEAEKGALSDAFKRAAVRWGVGRYLYNLGTIWVDLEKRGNSYVIAPSQKAKLEKHLRDFTARMVAPMTFGNPFGLALYDKSRANVTDEPDIDFKEIADGLIALVAACTTSAELAELKASERFGSEQNSLPDAQFQKLATVYKDKKAALMPKVA